MKYIFTTVVLSIISLNYLLCQTYDADSAQYVDYYEAIADLNDNGKESEFYTSLDYESMLYLDKASFHTFKKIDADFLERNYIDTSSIFITIANQYRAEFPTEYKSIETFLLTKSNWISTVKKLNSNFGNETRISKIIYTKDSTAVCTFLSKGLGAKYRITVKDGMLKFELLYQVIE